MDSVNFVEINTNGIGSNKNIIIDIKKNTVNFNGNIKSISDDRILCFFRIIRNWKSMKNNSGIVDAEKIIIRIVGNDYEELIECVGQYPKNYLEFKKWIGDIYGFYTI